MGRSGHFPGSPRQTERLKEEEHHAMNLVRLAVLTLSDSPHEADQGAWRTEADDVQLTAHTLQKDPRAAHMLVTAELPLDSLPSRDESGQVVIDEESLR